MLELALSSAILILPVSFQESPPAVKPEPIEVVESPADKPDPENASSPPEEEDPKSDRQLTPSDYGKFESVRRVSLSPDGRWLAYDLSRVDETREIRLRMLATENDEVLEQGGGAQFSKDSRYLAYSIVPKPKSDGSDSPSDDDESKVALRNLVDGGEVTFEGASQFAFSDDGQFLAMIRRKSGRKDLIVRRLAHEKNAAFGNVSSFSWSDSRAHLALIIDAEDNVGNGVQLYDCHLETLRILDSSESDYSALTWRKDAFDLACFREGKHEKNEDSFFDVLAFEKLDDATLRTRTLNAAKHPQFPDDRRIVDGNRLRWSEDGRALFFGVKEWWEKPKSLSEDNDKSSKESKKPKESEEKDKDSKEGKASSLRETLEKDPAGVEVWHAKDIDIIPLQKRRLSAEEAQAETSVWWLQENRFVKLAGEPYEDVEILDGDRYGIATDNTPYEELKRFGPTLFDVALVDVWQGTSTKILERQKYILGSDPKGRFVLYLRDNHVWTYNVDSGAHRNLTGDLNVPFVNQEMSNLTDEKPPYGVGGWLKNGETVFLYDRYDIWSFPMSGEPAKRMTRGREDAIVHRLVRLDREETAFDSEAPFYVSLYGDLTKESGFGRMRLGEGMETLVWKARDVSRLIRADEAPKYAYIEGDFNDSPDIMVSGPKLENPRQISKTNPFMNDYDWGKSELVDYKNVHGQDLQGALFYPANYEEGKTYPMIVYIYELRSQVLHSFVTPTERHPYNPTVFTTQGYFVYQPDIVYRAQNPGLSAVECVVPAVEKVLESGMIDKDRVGLVGHSWGAYQTAFIVTQTNLFAAGIAGAPLTNMMSMSMSIYWNSGQTDAWIFHESQGRMDRPFWLDVDTYIKNSPIFQIEKLETPLLVAFGDEDGAVDWQQGVEMYNAARLAQRPFVMLVYPGENHSVQKKPNQIDYHYRIIDWFGHYLKGEPIKPWIEEGVPHLKRQRELRKIEGDKGGSRGGRGRP